MKEVFVYMPGSITQVAPVAWPGIEPIMTLACAATYWSWVVLKLLVDIDLGILWAMPLLWQFFIYEQVLQDFRYHF